MLNPLFGHVIITNSYSGRETSTRSKPSSTCSETAAPWMKWTRSIHKPKYFFRERGSKKDSKQRNERSEKDSKQLNERSEKDSKLVNERSEVSSAEQVNEGAVLIG